MRLVVNRGSEVCRNERISEKKKKIQIGLKKKYVKLLSFLCYSIVK